MIHFEQMEEIMNAHNVHTMIDTSKGMVMLCVRGEANIGRWTEILGEVPGYPLNTQVMPIAMWIFLVKDMRYHIVVDTCREEAGGGEHVLIHSVAE